MYIDKNKNSNENVVKKKKRERDLPIDYQTGSCHGKNKTMENIGKSKEMMKK